MDIGKITNDLIIEAYFLPRRVWSGITPEVEVDHKNKTVVMRDRLIGSNLTEAYFHLKRYSVIRHSD